MDKLTKLGPAFIKGKPAGSWASIVLEQVEDLQRTFMPDTSHKSALLVLFPYSS